MHPSIYTHIATLVDSILCLTDFEPIPNSIGIFSTINLTC